MSHHLQRNHHSPNNNSNSNFFRRTARAIATAGISNQSTSNSKSFTLSLHNEKHQEQASKALEHQFDFHPRSEPLVVIANANTISNATHNQTSSSAGGLGSKNHKTNDNTNTNTNTTGRYQRQDYQSKLKGFTLRTQTTNQSHTQSQSQSYSYSSTMTTAQPQWSNPHAPPPPPNNGSAPPGQQHPTGTAVVPESYFTESRKGEVNELRQLLRNFSLEKDPMRKREIIKKVIAYMTLGIDVSRLFTEMMLVIETRDLVIKKMVYLFLCNYASANPELAQMCTNTLTKDCGNDDPMVRGLALRSLCSLRLPQMVEYVSEPVRRSLNDSHAYVRKTAVMGILKLYHLDPNVLEENGFVETLYDMLKDPDCAVVTNCIIVLNEVLAKGPDGGMAINRAIMLHLLNRLSEFSEFGVLTVLDLVPRYIPADEEEGYQIMNLLDPMLKTTNSGAFMAVIFAFLSLMKNFSNENEGDAEAMKLQVVSRVKAPLITMMTGGSSELMHCLLKHVDALIENSPGVFDDEYRQFYIRYHEPTSVKYLKITVLAKMANPDNAPDIVAELAECVSDMDAELGRLSVRAMASIACRDVGGEGCAESIAGRLVEMMDLDIPHVSSEAATALTVMLRKHPSLKGLVAPPLPRALKYMTENSGKASVIHLLGECGDISNEAPYSLEKLIDGYDNIKEAEVKIVLLTSTMKLFFKRPPETQKMLGKLLQKATEDVSSQDLHDRALLYYRLLRSAADPTVLQEVIATDCTITGQANFSEDEIDDDIRDELMKEFNTLSIIYGNTSDTFIAPEHQVEFVRMPKEHPLSGNSPPVEDLAVNNIANEESMPSGDNFDPAPVAPPVTTPAPPVEMDLLGFGPEPTPAPIVPPTNASSSLSLTPNFTLSSEEYQSRWGDVPDANAHVMVISLNQQPPSTSSIEEPLGLNSITTMASGELPDEMKFFLYCKDASVDGTIILVQASVSKAASPVEIMLTLKLSGPGDRTMADEFVELMKSSLATFA